MRQTVKLGPHPASARRARDAVRGMLEGHTLGARVMDTALILTSELVVDATLHGGRDIDLALYLNPDASVLRISVTEREGSGAGDADEGERDLQLVEELATRCGTEVGPTGARTTWFELAYVTSVE